MANFDPPFGSVGGVNRSPTRDEQRDGFPCGAADQTLFNRLFGRLEAELKAIQDEGGIAGSEADDTTVLQAIQAMISAATGGGDTSQYVLFSQAQARLPIFPEVTGNSGFILVTAPATGLVRAPAGASILHRGIGLHTTQETDFATIASKTYHLRWNRTDGFLLQDLSDTAYNPGVLAETDASFDTTFDDMLVSRIVTNSNNVATITNLLNLSQMDMKGDTIALGNSGFQDQVAPGDLGPGNSGSSQTFDINWSRMPLVNLAGFTDVTVQNGSRTSEVNVAAQSLSRYQVRCIYERTANAAFAYVGFTARA